MPEDQQMLQVEAEIVKMQIELRQIRQMISSLIATEEQTIQMMSQQPKGHQAIGQQGMGQQAMGQQGMRHQAMGQQGMGQQGMGQQGMGQQGMGQQAMGQQAMGQQGMGQQGMGQQGMGQQGMGHQAMGQQAMGQQGMGQQGMGQQAMGQQGMGQQGMGQGGGQPQSRSGNANLMSAFPPNLISEDQRALEQYNIMRKVAEGMNRQVQDLSQSFNLSAPNPNTPSAQQMNLSEQDPMQRPF